MENNAFIDIPVLETITYFANMLSRFYGWAQAYAYTLGFIGLCWSAFRLSMSRMQLKEFVWDQIFKWVQFLLFMTLYPMVTLSLPLVANKVGIGAGSAKEQIEQSLILMKNAIISDTQKNIGDKQKMMKDLSLSGLDVSYDFSKDYDENFYSAVKSQLNEKYVLSTKSTSKEKAKAQSAIKNIENLEQADIRYIANVKRLNDINSVLKEHKLELEDDYEEYGSKNLTESYVTLDIFMKNDGNDTGWISPAALMRLTLLMTNIIIAKQDSVLVPFGDEENINVEAHNKSKLSQIVMASFRHLMETIISWIIAIFTIMCVAFMLIQYVMTIIEWTIISSVGAFFIPFILFDGTKDLPKKLLPCFISFFIKILVMVICVMFVYYLMIQTIVEVIRETSGMNLIMIANIVFKILLCLVLTQNAPKIAQTLMTGSPQLSMGEFVQAAGTAGAAAALGAKGAVGAVRGGANTAINAHGSLAKMKSAFDTANSGIRANGGCRMEALKGGVTAAAKAFGGDVASSLKRKTEDFLHGGKKAGGRTGGGGSSARYNQPSGTILRKDAAGNTMQESLSRTSNAHFNEAQMVDPRTGQSRNMSLKEYGMEKRTQGAFYGGDEVAKFKNSKNKKAQKALDSAGKNASLITKNDAPKIGYTPQLPDKSNKENS